MSKSDDPALPSGSPRLGGTGSVPDAVGQRGPAGCQPMRKEPLPQNAARVLFKAPCILRRFPGLFPPGI